MKKIFVLTALCLTALLASAYNRGDHDYNYRYEEQQTKTPCRPEPQGSWCSI